MKKNLFFYLLFLFTLPSFSQSGQWVWMKGDTLFDVNQYAPKKGVEDSSYHPATLYNASTWTDDSGKFWMFGGISYLPDFVTFNFVWRFNPQTNNWAWMRGDCCLGAFGKYGTQGVTDSANYIGARAGAMLWKDNSNNIWIFGGSTSVLFYNDLWKYNMSTNEWTWMKGPNSWNIAGVYGTKGVAADANNPPTRREGATWIDDSNNLWLFGGFQETSNSLSNLLNDLWKYNISSNQWTWMGGTDTVNDEGVYGIKGVPDTANLPSSRSCNCSWSDGNQNFYLFGGAVVEFPGTYMAGDIWRYNTLNKEWTWLKGNNLENVPGVNGTFCNPDSDNYPISRMESSCIKIDSNKILMFGGKLSWTDGLGSISRDVWVYDFKENIWSRMWGDSSFEYGNYGTQGIYNPGNDPPSRYGAMSWFTTKNFWVYGGKRCGYGCSQGDLWRYTLDSNCLLGIYNGTEIIQSNAEQISIYPNPTADYITFDYLPNTGTITIFSITGVKLITTTISSASTTLNVASLSAGIYLVKIESGNDQQLSKFIKVDE